MPKIWTNRWSAILLTLCSCQDEPRPPAFEGLASPERRPAANSTLLLLNEIDTIQDVVEAKTALLAAYDEGRIVLRSKNDCDALHDVWVNAFCKSLSRHPHLQRRRPITNRPPPPPQAPPEGCAPKQSAFECLLDRAQMAARQGEPGPEVHCSQLTSPLWRSECYFQLAENTVSRGCPGCFEQAGSLCSDAGLYRTHCANHIVGTLAIGLPAAEKGNAQTWKVLAGDLARVLDLEQSMVNPDDSERDCTPRGLGDRFLAGAMVNLAAQTSTIPNGLLQQLPHEAAPHLRAALAWRMIPPDGRAPLDLDALFEHSIRVLEGSSPIPYPFPRDMMATRLELHGDRFQEHALASRSCRAFSAVEPTTEITAYVGPSYRLLGQNPSCDMAICLLEAAARLSDTPDRLLEEALEHECPNVGETARGLLQERYKRAQRSPKLDRAPAGPPTK